MTDYSIVWRSRLCTTKMTVFFACIVQVWLTFSLMKQLNMIARYVERTLCGDMSEPRKENS